MRDKYFPDVVLFVQHARHQGFLNPHQSANTCCGSRCHAPRLAGEASLAEKLTAVQHGDNRFLAVLGCGRKLHLAALDVEHGIRGFSLPEDGAVGNVFNNSFPGGGRREPRSETVLPRLNQESLAQMVGITRSRISHFMNKFKKLGFIDYEGVGLAVNNGLLSVVLND